MLTIYTINLEESKFDVCKTIIIGGDKNDLKNINNKFKERRKGMIDYILNFILNITAAVIASIIFNVLFK